MINETRAQIRWVCDDIRPDRSLYALLAGGRAAETLLFIAEALLARALIDGAVAGVSAAVLRYGLLMLAAALLSVGLSLGLARLGNHLERKWNIRLRTRLFAKLLESDYATSSRYHSGVLLDRLYTDVGALHANAVDLLPDLAAMAIGLIGAVGVLFWLDARLPLAVLAICALFTLTARLFKGFVAKHHGRMRDADAEAHAYYQESLENVLILKIFRGETPAVRRASYYERNAYGAWSRWYRCKQCVSGGVSLFFKLGNLAAMVLCAALLLRGALTFGTMTAILQLVSQIQSPFSEISTEIAMYVTMLLSAERLMELESLPSAETADFLDAPSVYGRLRMIEGRGLCFRYGANNRKVLRDADFSIRKGEFTALTGESGAGKSTLLKLLLGVYPMESGALRLVLDGGESLPLDASARSLFAYVPQGNLLFSGSIRDSLTFLYGEQTDDALWQVLRLSCAEDFVREIGLDAQLGESGRGLSEGQAQRLSLARALLSRAPILLLDEATSALDEATETQLLQNLRALPDRTLLIVSHKPAACAVCDRELHLCDGALLERRLRT